MVALKVTKARKSKIRDRKSEVRKWHGLALLCPGIAIALTKWITSWDKHGQN